MRVWLSLALFFGSTICGFGQQTLAVTDFIAYTHRGALEAPTPEDYLYGFPRVAFTISRDFSVTWISARLRATVRGSVTKKKQILPVEYTGEFSLDSASSNRPTLALTLPADFRNASITAVSVQLLQSDAIVPTKLVLAKVRQVSLDRPATAKYEDDFLAITFGFDPESSAIEISGNSTSVSLLEPLPESHAILEFNVKELPLPQALREEHYDAAAPSSGSAVPAELFTERIEIKDRQACTAQQTANIEIERDASCKSREPLFQKYMQQLQEGYVLVRVILPVRVNLGIRTYVFTFVVSKTGAGPKTKNPEEVSI